MTGMDAVVDPCLTCQAEAVVIGRNMGEVGQDLGQMCEAVSAID